MHVLQYVMYGGFGLYSLVAIGEQDGVLDKLEIAINILLRTIALEYIG